MQGDTLPVKCFFLVLAPSGPTSVHIKETGKDQCRLADDNFSIVEPDCRNGTGTIARSLGLKLWLESSHRLQRRFFIDLKYQVHDSSARNPHSWLGGYRDNGNGFLHVLLGLFDSGGNLGVGCIGSYRLPGFLKGHKVVGELNLDLDCPHVRIV